MDGGSIKKREFASLKSASSDDGGGGAELDTPPLRKLSKRSWIKAKARESLQKHFPEGSDKLKKFYQVAKDAEAEFDLLKQIVASHR